MYLTGPNFRNGTIFLDRKWNFEEYEMPNNKSSVTINYTGLKFLSMGRSFLGRKRNVDKPEIMALLYFSGPGIYFAKFW